MPRGDFLHKRLWGFGAATALAASTFAPVPAHASCAGLSADAIGQRFEAARALCGGTGRVTPAAPQQGTAGQGNAPEPGPAPGGAFELPVLKPVAIPFAGSARRPSAGRVTVRPRRAPSTSGTLSARASQYQRSVLAVARRYGIDPLLLDAIIIQESGYRVDARSYKGALGLMQLMPGTARGLGVRDVQRLTTDPLLNLAAGAAYLKQLQRELGNDIPRILAAYNAGPGAVRRYRGIPPYNETRGYVRNIMGRYTASRAAAK